MNKNVLIALIALIPCTLTVGYSQKINWGQAIAEDKNYSPTIIKDEGNFFYTCDYSNKEFSLEKFDKKNSTKLYSKKYEIPKKHEIEMVVVSDKRIIVFFSFYDGKKKTSEIYCNVYSSSDGKSLEANHTISSILAGDYSNYVLSLYKSADNNKVLITNSIYSKKEDRFLMYYILLDEKLAKIFEKEEIVGASRLIITEAIVGNNGSCYIQKRLYGDDTTKFVSFDADKSYEEYECTIDSDKIKIPKNGSLGYSNMTLSKNGDIIIIGEYFRDGIFSGYYFLSISPKTKQTVSVKINEFNDKLINQFLTQGQIKKNKRAMVPNYFRDMRFIAKEDGGIVGITQGIQYIETQRKTTNQQGFSRYDRIGGAVIYYDVMALNFSSDGTLTWANRIPRYQSYSSRRKLSPSKNADYLSSFSALSNDKLYIAYHDMPSNVAIKSDNERIKGFRMSKKAVIALFTIDLKTGDKDKRQFTEGTDLETFIEPATAYQESQSSDMIILGSKKTKFKYGIMFFNK